MCHTQTAQTNSICISFAQDQIHRVPIHIELTFMAFSKRILLVIAMRSAHSHSDIDRITSNLQTILNIYAAFFRWLVYILSCHVLFRDWMLFACNRQNKKPSQIYD